MSQRVLDLGDVDLRQALAGRAPDVEGREALLRVATVELELTVGKCAQQITTGRVEGPLLNKQVGEHPVRVAGPGAEGRDELVARHHTRLQGEQSEEKVVLRVDSSCHRCSSGCSWQARLVGVTVACSGRLDFVDHLTSYPYVQGKDITPARQALPSSEARPEADIDRPACPAQDRDARSLWR